MFSSNPSLPESAISQVLSPPTRTSRRNQSKSKVRPPEPGLDLELLKTLCNENDCNAGEVRFDLPLCVHTNTFLLFLRHLVSLVCVCVCLQCSRLSTFRSQVKNVYQTSFSAFLDSLDLSRTTEFPQVLIDPRSTCPADNLTHMLSYKWALKRSCCSCLLTQICPWKDLFLLFYCRGK